MNRLNWDDLRIFHALAQDESVRGAAAVLGIHHSTVARRLEQLEEQLGVLLFTRTPRGLQLTREGETIVASAKRVEREVNEIQRQVAGSDQALTGGIRLTLPDAMAGGFLMRELARFCQAYPDIELEFLPSYATLDIGQREADLAIRVTGTPPEHLIGRRLGRFSVAVYASRAYLEQHDPMLNPRQCSWVAWTNIDDRFQQMKNRLFPDIPTRTRCDNALLHLSAVASGVGLAVLPCAMGDSHPELLRVGDQSPVELQDIWLLSHPDLRGTARIKVLTGFISQAFADNEDLLLGRRRGAITRVA